MSSSNTQNVADTILTNLSAYRSQADANLEWIKQEMSPYFLNLNKEEVKALTLLTISLDKLETLEKVTLVDRKSRLMIAQLSSSGSIYKTIYDLPRKPLSYAEITTSFNPLPNSDVALEVIRCDFKQSDDANEPNEGQETLDSATREEIFGHIKGNRAHLKGEKEIKKDKKITKRSSRSIARGG